MINVTKKIVADVKILGKTKEFYALKNDFVEVVEFRSPAVIVKNKNAEKFSVNINNLI